MTISHSLSKPYFVRPYGLLPWVRFLSNRVRGSFDTIQGYSIDNNRSQTGYEPALSLTHNQKPTDLPQAHYLDGSNNTVLGQNRCPAS
ncbi:hypothetical protein J6590_004497 [Homalodisca vitripennis]|nr:hypothetical protein J6590_004497 [Homalodisca vitripennis]